MLNIQGVGETFESGVHHVNGKFKKVDKHVSKFGKE